MSFKRRHLPAFYPHIVTLCGPLLRVWLRLRSLIGKENRFRLKERRGIASLPRPERRLVWVHAASVGESLSALTLMQAIREHVEGDVTLLLTTGTLTSAEMVARRLDLRDIHQFIPLDNPKWVKRFLNHWQPDAVFWMESELWPTMLGHIKTRNIPAALVNARLSQRSAQQWATMPDWIETLLQTFTVTLAQSRVDEDRLHHLGAPNLTTCGNLKYAAQPLTVDQEVLMRWQSAIGQRPTLLYASTHSGEEALALSHHTVLKKKYPDLLTIIVPRHPNRGDSVWDSIDSPHAVRLSHTPDKLPDADTDIILADTMGELGLFYRLVPFAFIGNSLCKTPGGGHNPFEPLLCGCIPICGPFLWNFTRMVDDMLEANTLKLIDDDTHLLACQTAWLENPQGVADLHIAAKAMTSRTEQVLKDIMYHLNPVIKDI